MLDIIILILFICLIVYFVISFIVIKKYRDMKKMSRYLLSKYSVINRKAFVVDRCLSLHSVNKVTINEVYESFVSLYKDVADIEQQLQNDLEV